MDFTHHSLSELQGSTSTISLQLNGTNPSFPYYINIVPGEQSIPVKNATPIFDLILYDINTLYNMSIMICGELSIVPLIGLYYSKFTCITTNFSMHITIMLILRAIMYSQSVCRKIISVIDYLF